MSHGLSSAAGAVNPPSPFADHASAYRALGWAVIPTKGKRPLRAGFSRWRSAPAPRTVAAWAEAMPDADIAIVPGLSRAPDGSQIVTIDADDAAAGEWVTETLGWTPGRTKTRKGSHHHYRYSGPSLGRLHSLRPYGINADVKHGQGGAGIVVAPPSRHEADAGFRYLWDGCDPSVIRDLPMLPVDALRRLVTRKDTSPARGSETLPNITLAPRQGEASLFHGSRGLALNKHLCFQASYAESFDELLDVAVTWHEQHVDRGMPPLDEAEIADRTRQVWRDLEAGKLVKLRRGVGRGGVMMDGAEARNLSDAAFRFLAVLRLEHFGRDRFALAIKAMADARVMGSWAAEKYRSARDELIRAGMLVCVQEAGHRTPAFYSLTSRPPQGGGPVPARMG